MKSVLIIDDSRAIRNLVKKCLHNIGATVAGEAEDGEEGIEMYRTLLPDIVLLDVTMPNKDGRQCLREIIESHPHAYVVMLSSITSPEVVSECIALGARTFLNKTDFTDSSLLEAELRKCIECPIAAKVSGGRQ